MELDTLRWNDDGAFSPVGTGFLVRPNLVLTNNHVVENLEPRGGRVVFDYKTAGTAAVNGRVVAFAVESPGASSHPARCHLSVSGRTSSGAPTGGRASGARPVAR